MSGPSGGDAGPMLQRFRVPSIVPWVDDLKHKSLATRHSIVYLERWS